MYAFHCLMYMSAHAINCYCMMLEHLIMHDLITMCVMKLVF